jgi:hypothetical protein
LSNIVISLETDMNAVENKECIVRQVLFSFTGGSIRDETCF